MKISALLQESRKPLMEGGNLSVGGHEAEHLDLKVTKRGYMVPKLNELLASINRAFYAKHKAPLWSAQVLKSGEFLSGSSLHFFNVAGIEDETFYAKKPTVGDIDTMVDKRLEHTLQEFLTEATNRQIGSGTLLGFQKGNEQFSALFELQDPPVKVQIDFEFVAYDNGLPTDWARFSHSSSWEDIQQGVKGVFHKWLIQSLTTLTNKQFLLRKMTGRGAMRKEEDVPTTDNMYSFAVSSKEGGGLRAKYEPVLNPGTNKPLMKDGLMVMRALPASGYEQDIGKIFSTILGKRLDPKQMQALSKNFWSFTGLVQLMGQLLTPEDKKQVLDGFLVKTIGKGSQGLYKNDPEKDIKEKTTAINYLVKTLGLQLPANYKQLMADYKANYKMTELSEDAPNYKRQGIPHIYKPGSTVEMKDADFIEFCKEIIADGGKLEGTPINLKVDGAGIRFGKDDSGRPFFMTSKVTEPKYIENFGDFEAYGRSVGQDEQRLNFTKQYDNALKTILTAPFMKVVPNDTIIQAEMMFTPMAQKEDGGLKFVNIPYDPKKLGKVMTLVPFMFKQFSTGATRPDADKIKEALLKTSNPTIKMVNNNLQHKGIDVAKIVAPIVKNAGALLTAVKERGMTPAKEKAKAILSQARQQLSNAIINGPIPGKDQLGDMIEGLVINMPSGRLAKVTSTDMAAKMATKMAARQPVKSNRTKPAVVTVGSFVGHKGHEQLINQTIATAKQVGGDPYVYVSPMVGPEDPIPANVKVETLRKLFPEIANNIQVWDPKGTPMKKIEKELVLPPNSPYNKIILLVGDDRYESMTKWMEALEKRMKDPVALAKYGGTQDQVQFQTVRTERDPSKGGTGISFTMLRDILRDPNATPEQQLELWGRAFDVNKLGKEWIMKLMEITKQGMGVQQQQPVSESRIMDRDARINAYYVSTKGDRHRVAENIPYYLLDKLVPLLTKKYAITMNDIEVRPADKNQYRRTSQPELAEGMQCTPNEVAELLYNAKPELFTKFGDEFVMNAIEQACEQHQGSAQEVAHKVVDILKQGLSEAYDHNAPFNAADFNRHMEQLRAREELRKTDPVKALVGDLIDKDNAARNVKKKSQDDSSMDINDPRHPGWGALHNTLEESPEEALKYATKAHAGQTRSGGDPYISHPIRVANHIKQYKQSHNLDALIAAAYLHDTIEDTDTTQEVLHDLFGGLVASLVKELTSDPEQIKKMGKAQYLSHKMAAMSSYGLVIKLADRLDNVKDITTARTPQWRAKYAAETNQILDYIEKTRALSGTHNKLISLIRAKLAEIDNPPQQQGISEAPRKPRKPAAPQFTKYTNYELWERERYARGANYTETEIDGRLVGVAVVGTTYNEWGYVRDTGKVVGMWYNKASIGSFVQDGTSFDDSLSYAEQDTTWPYMNESQGMAESQVTEAPTAPLAPQVAKVLKGLGYKFDSKESYPGRTKSWWTPTQSHPSITDLVKALSTIDPTVKLVPNWQYSDRQEQLANAKELRGNLFSANFLSRQDGGHLFVEIYKKTASGKLARQDRNQGLDPDARLGEGQQGVAEAEGISRRGILKGIAGAGALGAAGKASAIAGAFPTPSAQAAMYKAAADSNAAQARADAAEKAKRDAQRLKQGTGDIERLNKINYHGGKVTPTNAEWDGDGDFMYLDGTQYSMASRMPISGDEPRDMKLISTREGRQVYIWTRYRMKGDGGHYFYPAPAGSSQINEFAPGNGDDDGLPQAEYEVYQCSLDDQFDWIGEPLMQTDRLDKAHGFAYNLWQKHPDKCFMIWQEKSQGSRGGYGPVGSVLAPSEDDITESSDYLDEK